MLSGQYCQLVLEPTQDKDADPQIALAFPYTTMRNQIRAKDSLGTANRESQMDKERQKVAGPRWYPTEPGFVWETWFGPHLVTMRAYSWL